MSIDIQKNIKDNSRNVSDYFADLVKWEEDETKRETRREAKKRGVKANTAKPVVPPPRGSSQQEPSGEKSEEAIARDKLPMPQYYHNWDQFDPEDQVDQLNQQEDEENRKVRQSRQAEKDRILDEMAWKGDGDRVRTTKARPLVKINVRTTGRRPAPIDLAKPKKEEANNYFAQGRYKEAMIAYTAALDYLEKYEPTGDKNPDNGSDDNVQTAADGVGVETEAIELKTVLLANRAQALIKVEEWREAIEDCDEALRFDPSHHKATLRRGFALAKQKRWAAAARDLARAVANDPADRKAAAELQMARRNLAEQAIEVRAHAKAIICDTTREPTMPSRKLTVKVGRPGSAYEEAATSCAGGSATSTSAPTPSSVSQPQPRGARGEARAPVDLDAPGPPVASPEVRAAAEPRARQPYVPRSVRIRGRQQAPEAAGYQGSASGDASSAPSSREADVTPAVNFYSFEAKWTQNRRKPHERATMLRRIGAAALPTLFRESLDAELVGSIISVLTFELSSESKDAVSFASSVLGALSRTQRFKASLLQLSAEEMDECQVVLSNLERCADKCTEDLVALRQAFEPPPPIVQFPGGDEDEEYDEDDRPEAFTSANPLPVASAASKEEVPENEPPMKSHMLAPPESAVGVAEFSLDGCD